MRILLASCIERSLSTGMGKWTARIAEQLRARGHEVIEFYAADLWPHGGRLGRHLFGPSLACWSLRHRDSVDVVIVHEPHAASSALLRLLVRSVPAIVVMSHGVESRVVQELRSAAKHQLAARSVADGVRHALVWGTREAVAFRTASRILCLSEADRRFLVARFCVEPARVVVLINGADPPLVAAAPEVGSAVLCLGSWIDEKGRRALPRLWRAVRRVNSTAHLIVAGTGAGQSEVLADFDPLDRDSVEVLPSFGALSELSGVFSRAALFLLPSLREGSPLALLEAMAHGLPVVAAAVGGVPDLVTDGREGFLYPSIHPEIGAERVLSVLDDPARRRVLGDAARERVRSATWAQTAIEVEKACQAAIEEG